LVLSYLSHFQEDQGQGAVPPEAEYVDIGQLSARKNAADTDAYVSEIFYHN